MSNDETIAALLAAAAWRAKETANRSAPGLPEEGTSRSLRRRLVEGVGAPEPAEAGDAVRDQWERQNLPAKPEPDPDDPRADWRNWQSGE